jgi:NADPH:quinone reductase-like Zn-dependent oxidoreductase
MKAVRIHEFGGPETLQLEELPMPVPETGEILIRVLAASVNPVDYKIRKGGYLPPDALPLTLGRDVAGVVERLGAEVRGFQQGEGVYVMLDRIHGGYAEYVADRATNCARKPRRLDFIQAAAVPLAGLTAWQGLFDHGELKAGERVLIHGAAGGVGHFAVQFARARGAEVYATCSADDVAFVKTLGAAVVIDYHKDRFEDRVRDVDLVFDLVDGETQDRSFAVLKPGGRLISTLKAPDKAKCAATGVRGAHYMARPSGEELAEIARLIDEGQVTPSVEGVFPLRAAADAEKELETAHVRGKLVLAVEARP